MCPSLPFGIEGMIWDVILLIPDHCLFFFLSYSVIVKILEIMAYKMITITVLKWISLMMFYHAVMHLNPDEMVKVWTWT